MATIGQIADLVAELRGLDPMVVLRYRRSVKAAGFIVTGGRGKSAPEIDVLSATALFLGTFNSTAEHAGEFMDRISKLQPGRGEYSRRQKGEPRFMRALRDSSIISFPSAVASLMHFLGSVEGVEAAEPWDLDLSITVPNPRARITATNRESGDEFSIQYEWPYGLEPFEEWPKTFAPSALVWVTHEFDKRALQALADALYLVSVDDAKAMGIIQ